MTFSESLKIEAITKKCESDTDSLAFLCGLVMFAGELSFSKGSFCVDIITDIEALAQYVNEIVNKMYGEIVSESIDEDYSINKKTYHRITIPKLIAEELLSDIGLLERGENGTPTLVDEIPQSIIAEDSTKKAFVKGCFVASSTTNIKLSERAEEKTTSGYHLEFTSHNHSHLLNLADVLAEFSLSPKITKRKNTYVLYIKEANQISDIFAIVGADEGVVKLQNEIIAREMRNKINRETNCFSANIEKTVEASMKQVDAIKTINEIIGLDKLPPDLEEVALLRLANQEESLDELLQLSALNITKSGLNHRFRKIIKIATELKK